MRATHSIYVWCVYLCFVAVVQRRSKLMRKFVLFNAVGETPFALTNDTGCFNRKCWILFWEKTMVFLYALKFLYFRSLLFVTLARNFIRHIRSDKRNSNLKCYGCGNLWLWNKSTVTFDNIQLDESGFFSKLFLNWIIFSAKNNIFSNDLYFKTMGFLLYQTRHSLKIHLCCGSLTLFPLRIFVLILWAVVYTLLQFRFIICVYWMHAYFLATAHAHLRTFILFYFIGLNSSVFFSLFCFTIGSLEFFFCLFSVALFFCLIVILFLHCIEVGKKGTKIKMKEEWMEINITTTTITKQNKKNYGIKLCHNTNKSQTKQLNIKQIIKLCHAVND